MLYADTSALLRAYFADEPDHGLLRALLLEGEQAVITSEIARIEAASAIGAAARAGRLRRPSNLLARFDADCGEGGPLTLIALRSDRVFPTAHRFVVEHHLRTLDAIHLAVAVEEGRALAGSAGMVIVTRDDDQANAARNLGFEVR